ncbi:MAG: hypothetical protein ACSHXK_07945 [Oceanococcus sp.]
MYKLLARVVASVLLLGGATVQAAEFNYKQLLTGERAAGFAGAYVALSDDNTGMFYNPAGMVQTEESLATASINLISASSTKYENVYGATGYQRSSIDIVPGFIGSMWEFRGGRLGVSMAVVDSNNEDQAVIFKDVVISDQPPFNEPYDELYVQNDYKSRTYDVGLSAAWPLSSVWSVGGTLYLRYSDKDFSLLQRLSINEPGAEFGEDKESILGATNIEDTAIGLRPILGLMYRDQRFSFGMTVSHVFSIMRDYSYSLIAEAQQEGFNFASFSESDISESGLSGPWQLSLAGALFGDSGSITTLQMDYYTSRKAPDSRNPDEIPAQDLSTEAVLNLAFGMELPLNENWSTRFGAYSNLANVSVSKVALFTNSEEIDMYGLTFSVTRIRESGDWTVGMQLAQGSGKATLGGLGLGLGDSNVPVAAERQRINFFVSTSL